MVDSTVREVICTRCILDTSIPDIQFDSSGVCTFCKIHDRLDKQAPLDMGGLTKLALLVGQIKKKGGSKKYNCIVGVSGGRDSTYTLYITKKLGLRPLAVHFNNGWNSKIAIRNLRKVVDKLGVDLHTIKANWEEFKDLQKAFLEASVPDVSGPTDYAVISVLFQVAAELGIKYILNGHSFRTEGIAPINWAYMDDKYIKSIHRRFGKGSITSFPLLSLPRLSYYILLKGIKYVPLLQYLDSNQREIDKLLTEELEWEYYGGHHHDSTYTYFVQSTILPGKFGIDKRKTEYSALVRSGQMTREEALEKVGRPYPYNEETVKYVTKNLGLTVEDLLRILSAEKKTFHDYPTYYPLIRLLKLPVKVASKLNLLPNILYEKYLGG